MESLEKIHFRLKYLTFPGSCFIDSLPYFTTNCFFRFSAKLQAHLMLVFCLSSNLFQQIPRFLTITAQQGKNDFKKKHQSYGLDSCMVNAESAWAELAQLLCWLIPCPICLDFQKHILCRVIVSTGATGAAASINLGQRVHAPVNFQAWYYYETFCLIFPANRQVVHLSIEKFNPDATFCQIFLANGQILQPVN